MLVGSSLELGKIFFALQVFGKFIKRACSEIIWRFQTIRITRTLIRDNTHDLNDTRGHSCLFIS